MSTSPLSVSPQPKLVAALARSRSLSTLWMIRMLVRLGAFNDLYENRKPSSRDSVLRRLHLPNLAAREDAQDVLLRLDLTLRRMEHKAGQFRFGRILEANLALLGRRFGLSVAERKVLALAVLMRADDDMYQVGMSSKLQVNAADQIASIVGLPANTVADALGPNSKLRRSGLIEVQNGNTVAHNLCLRRGGLRQIALRRMSSLDELFGMFLHAAPPAALTDEHYAHLAPDLGFVAEVIRDALDNKRPGVNVLLYGPPGTGKTELARTLARKLVVPLFEVSSDADSGEPLNPRMRLAGAATAQVLLSGRRALLSFDEIDAIFNDGSDFFGKPTTAETAKAWVNSMLEENQVPTIWISNRIANMDPAFVRRFDLVIKLDTPPMKQRAMLLRRTCGSFLDAPQIARLSQVDTITPAVLTRAAEVVTRVAAPDRTRAAALECLLDGTLRAQGHPTVRHACRGMPPVGYDIGLCNASEDLQALAASLAQTKAGRLCLYGPPGTGKTAFGYWLANTLGKPLMLKRTSDIQSPLVGEMERKLAKAFEQATQNGAVLQIDEVDTFLQERSHAQHSWQISQVNEFLTQLESFEGIFIASTNLMDSLDQAALRRFDHKIKMGYLRREQAWELFRCQIDVWALPNSCLETCRRELATMDYLTPGDFAVVARRHSLIPFRLPEKVIEALRQEIALRKSPSRRIGFIR